MVPSQFCSITSQGRVEAKNMKPQTIQKEGSKLMDVGVSKKPGG